MAKPSEAPKKFVCVEGEVTLWWDEAGDEMHVSIDDPDLVDPMQPNRGKGLFVSANCNKDSANYNPAVYNRIAGALRKHGKPAPVNDMPDGQRKLNKRGWRKVAKTEAI